MQSDVEVDEASRLAVEAMCSKIGIQGTSKALGMGRDSVLRVIARQPVRKGTVLVLREALAALQQEKGA